MEAQLLFLSPVHPSGLVGSTECCPGQLLTTACGCRAVMAVLQGAAKAKGMGGAHTGATSCPASFSKPTAPLRTSRTRCAKCKAAQIAELHGCRPAPQAPHKISCIGHGQLCPSKVDVAGHCTAGQDRRLQGQGSSAGLAGSRPGQASRAGQGKQCGQHMSQASMAGAQCDAFGHQHQLTDDACKARRGREYE